MIFTQFKEGYQKLLLFVCMCMLPVVASSAKVEVIAEKQMSVIMRTIGHELLNCSGNYESRIMPIEKIGGLYKIPFEHEFGVDPDDVISIVDRVMKQANVSTDFLVEVEQCETKAVVHSFIVGKTYDSNSNVCAGRVLPKDCYSLLITILVEKSSLAYINATTSGTSQNLLDSNIEEGSSDGLPITLSDTEESNPLNSSLLFIPLLFLIGFIGYVFNKKHILLPKKQSAEIDPNLIMIGASQFDKRNMVLTFNSAKVELSHKEAELLSLLHASANTPLEREVILQKVWEDEGDYVGRTLDVFISKLRKKLESDVSVKIINIRGIGYKLVMDVPA